MSEFYDRMAATSSRLITKFGQKITIVRVEGEDNDPVSGVETAGINRNFIVNGLLNKYADKLIDGTRIKMSDRLLVLEPKVEPELTDKIEIGSQNWNIEDINTSNPAGTPLVYFVQVRR